MCVVVAYSDKVVAFLRQPNVMNVLRERYPTVASSNSLRNKIALVQSGGAEVLERFSNDVNLIMLLSLFEHEIMTFVPSGLHYQAPSSRAADSPQDSPQGSPGMPIG